MQNYRSLSLFFAIAIHAIALTLLLMFGISKTAQLSKQPQEIDVQFLKVDNEPKPKQIKKEQTQPKKQNVPQKVIATNTNQTSDALSVQKSENTLPKSNDETKKAAPITLPDFSADYLHNPAPSYPMASKKMREEGKVVLKVLVSSNGEALRVEIKTSSGFERLDNAALNAIQKWKFVPAKSGEQNIEAWVNVPINFKLSS